MTGRIYRVIYTDGYMMYEHNNDAHAIVLIIIEKLMRQMYSRHKYVHEKISTYLGYDIENPLRQRQVQC